MIRKFYKKAHWERFLQPLQTAVDIILPPRCFITGGIVSRQGMVSPEFWQTLQFIHSPYCAQCGLPFEFPDMDETALCGNCLQTPQKFDLARSALVYNDGARQMLLRFKYGDKLHAAVTFAQWQYQAAGSILPEYDLIVPVPLRWRRMLQRRYNQSALIAQALSRLCGRPVAHALMRKRFSSPQKGLSRRERLKNVRMSFKINPRYQEDITGKNIVLIDDVMTSGATVNECAKVLKQKGAAKILVLTVARVMKDQDFQPEDDIYDLFSEGY